MSIEINEELMTRAQLITGITDKNALIEKALRLLIAVETQKNITAQKGLMKLKGKVQIDDEPYK